MKINVLNLKEGRALIEPAKIETGFGELESDVAKNRLPSRGYIKSISEDLVGILEVDSVVYYRKYAPDKVEFDGIELNFVEANDILAVELSSNKSE